METVGSGHLFEELCARAARRRWCWKIRCTTCGAIEFRGALWELGVGSKAPRGGRALLRAWPREVQRAVVEQAESADVEWIVGNAPLPDGLGYLALTLAITAEVEAEDRRLTAAWVPQLEKLVAPSGVESAGARFMSGDVLRWGDLGAVETALFLRH